MPRSTTTRNPGDWLKGVSQIGRSKSTGALVHHDSDVMVTSLFVEGQLRVDEIWLCPVDAVDLRVVNRIQFRGRHIGIDDTGCLTVDVFTAIHVHFIVCSLSSTSHHHFDVKFNIGLIQYA